MHTKNCIYIIGQRRDIGRGTAAAPYCVLGRGGAAREPLLLAVSACVLLRLHIPARAGMRSTAHRVRQSPHEEMVGSSAALRGGVQT